MRGRWLQAIALVALTSLVIGPVRTDAQTPAEVALEAGDVVLARKLANATLTSAPNDATALAVLAATDLSTGAPRAARAHARRAYAAAAAPELRYVSARLAARAAQIDASPLASQFWLRRAVQVAPDARARQSTIDDITALRRDTRLRFSVDFAVSPSDNVNNGSGDRVLSVDGRQTIFVFDGSALALSGIEASAALGMRYRLSGVADNGTEVGVRLRQTEVALSPAARRIAPTARNTDYASTSVDLILGKTMRLADGKYLSGTAVVTQNWLAGDPWSRQAQLGVALAFPVGKTTIGRLSLAADRQWRSANIPFATALSAEAGLERRLTTGDIVGLRVGASKTLSRDRNQENTRLVAEVRYLRDKPVAGGHLSMGVSASSVDYPVFFGGLFGTSGRTDTSVAASVDMAFPEIGAFGFEPVVSLKGSRTRSNVSRYETKALGVEVRIKSSF